MKQTLSKNFKLLRERLGLTQQQMADYLNISNRVSISQYENGERELPLNVLESCCNLFGIELIEMFEEDEAKVLTNIHFAFRADELNSDDIKSISQFKKIIGNYQRMKRILGDEQIPDN